MQLRSLRMVAPGQLDEGGVGVRAIFHPGLVRVISGGAIATGKANSMNSGAAHQRRWSSSRALLVGGWLVQLLILLGRVVRVGDPAVDERRGRRRSGGIRRSRRRSGSAESGTSILLRLGPGPAPAAATFRPRAPSMARAPSMSRRARRVASAINSPRRAGAVLIFERLRIAAHQRSGGDRAQARSGRPQSRRSAATR